MRIALGLEYDGTYFHGWQRQDGLRTIQEAVEKALSSVAASPIDVVCAGRTDAGVHALEQVIHFETDIERPIDAWQLGANANLPKDIIVLWSKVMPDDFHARFSATERRYRYVILNRKTPSPIHRNITTHVKEPLDEKRMHEAGQSLLGEHDFSSFRASECQSKTAIRCVHHLTVYRENDLVIVEIAANAFLHHMVRNIVGVLLPIGAGKKPVNWVREVLEHKDRRLAGVTAKPEGLYLEQVGYPS